MNSQLFFYLNLAIGFGLIVWYLLSRKNSRQNPTALDLRKKSRVIDSEPTQGNSQKRVTRDVSASSSGTSAPSSHDAPEGRQTKTLNVLFMYNGHDWDAYQVLGVPAGAQLATVTARYQELIRGANAGQIEFYEAAYQAILRKT